MKLFFSFLKESILEQGKRVFLFSFLFLFLLSSVSAIGISPPSFTIDYEGAQTYSFDVKIINNGAPESFVSLQTKGDMSDHVSFSEYQFQFRPNEKMHEVTIHVDLPAYNELTVFGKQRIEIKAREDAPDNTGMMAFRTSVSGLLIVDIPVPGKLGKINTFDMRNTNEGYAAPFTLIIDNKGTEKLTGVSAQVIVKDYEGTQLDTMLFENIVIDFDESYTIEEVFPTQSYESSKYFATAILTYDPTKAPLSKNNNFFVGSTDVTLINYTPTLLNGKINKVELNLQSLWGAPLRNIRGSISYAGQTQNLPVIDFTEFQLQTIEAYLDIPLLEEETLEATLTLDIPVDEETDAQKIIPLTFTVVESLDPQNESPFSGSSLVVIGLIIAVALLVAVNVYIYVKKKNDKKD